MALRLRSGLAVLLLTSCWTEQDIINACVDAGRCDAGAVVSTDAGSPLDAGTADAGRSDSGTPDAGSLDAGAPDAGSLDAGVADSGTPDAGSLDAGPLDAGSDAGAADAGVLDAGPADAGRVDAGCVRSTCATIGITCGPVPDGCGGTLSCGTSCPATQVCLNARCYERNSWPAVQAELATAIATNDGGRVSFTASPPPLAPLPGCCSSPVLLGTGDVFTVRLEPPNHSFTVLHSPSDGGWHEIERQNDYLITAAVLGVDGLIYTVASNSPEIRRFGTNLVRDSPFSVAQLASGGFHHLFATPTALIVLPSLTEPRVGVVRGTNHAAVTIACDAGLVINDDSWTSATLLSDGGVLLVANDARAFVFVDAVASPPTAVCAGVASTSIRATKAMPTLDERVLLLTPRDGNTPVRLLALPTMTIAAYGVLPSEIVNAPADTFRGGSFLANGGVLLNPAGAQANLLAMQVPPPAVVGTFVTTSLDAGFAAHPDSLALPGGGVLLLPNGNAGPVLVTSPGPGYSMQALTSPYFNHR